MIFLQVKKKSNNTYVRRTDATWKCPRHNGTFCHP
jgi:hypothetical protein